MSRPGDSERAAAGRDRRLRPGRLLRRRAPAAGRTRSCVEVDMFDRLPTPFGPRPRRRRARPPEDQVRDRASTRRPPAKEGSGSSATSSSAATSPPTTCSTAITRSSTPSARPTDRQLGIPGEDLPGSHAATEFVAWYNGHPDFADREFDLDCERVVVVGNGNVATDVRPDARAEPRRAGRPTPPTTRSTCSRLRASRRSSSSAAAARRRRRSPTPSCASSAS